MKNQVIEVLDQDHGKRVIEYWKSKGVDTGNSIGCCTKDDGVAERYYGVIGGSFGCYTIKFVRKHNAETIKLPPKPQKEEETFPRVMLVSDDAVTWNKAVAVCLRGGFAFATTIHSSVEEYEDALKRGGSVPFYFWNYHKELSDRNKVTKAEIAEKFGIEPEQLEIVE